MAENKKSFLCYCDWITRFDQMPDEFAGRLFKLILHYVNDKNPVVDDFTLSMAFEPIKEQLKRDLVKYEEIRAKRAEAGKRSAESKKENKRGTKSTSVESVEQTSTKSTDIVKDTVTVIDTVIVKEKDIFNYNEIIDFFNANCIRLPEVKALTDKRKKSINARIREHGKETVFKMMHRAGQSDFLSGQNQKGWTADFNWLFRPENFVKVLEGSYDNKEGLPQVNQSQKLTTAQKHEIAFQNSMFNPKNFNHGNSDS